MIQIFLYQSTLCQIFHRRQRHARWLFPIPTALWVPIFFFFILPPRLKIQDISTANKFLVKVKQNITYIFLPGFLDTPLRYRHFGIQNSPTKIFRSWFLEPLHILLGKWESNIAERIKIANPGLFLRPNIIIWVLKSRELFLVVDMEVIRQWKKSQRSSVTRGWPTIAGFAGVRGCDYTGPKRQFRRLFIFILMDELIMFH